MSFVVRIPLWIIEILAIQGMEGGQIPVIPSNTNSNTATMQKLDMICVVRIPQA